MVGAWVHGNANNANDWQVVTVEVTFSGKTVTLQGYFNVAAPNISGTKLTPFKGGTLLNGIDTGVTIEESGKPNEMAVESGRRLITRRRNPSLTSGAWPGAPMLRVKDGSTPGSKRSHRFTRRRLPPPETWPSSDGTIRGSTATRPTSRGAILPARQFSPAKTFSSNSPPRLGSWWRLGTTTRGSRLPTFLGASL